MSKRSSKYPPDEFDAATGDGVPAGVHRAPRSRWSRVWPYLAVVFTCSLLAVGVVYYVYYVDDAPPSATPTTGATTAPDATATEPPADEVPVPETPVEPTEEPTVDPTTEPAAEPADTDTPVRVLNGTGRNGVAAGAAGDLEDEGWTDLTAATYEGAALDNSVVYFKTAEFEAEATEVARILGISNVFEAPSLVGPVSAVLIGDFGR
ncbi:LytR C-terminal domain-containing protein [Sanguibacter sp. 25GB23B1]|uniref:LytR C-terminal domain-containing protein n=1 Tax=unclassified Sanguibacter TaxID=2645534 RepID=UPI0032AF1C35